MKLQLIHRETGEVLFNGDEPGENLDAWKLATAQEVIAVYKPETDKELKKEDLRPEVAYAAIFLWACVGLMVLGAASGFGVYLFFLTSGL